MDPENEVFVQQAIVNLYENKTVIIIAHRLRTITGCRTVWPVRILGYVRSPYNKYMTEQGCPELNVLFCENDVYTYGKLSGLKFTRTKTIGAGDDLCDFKMEII